MTQTPSVTSIPKRHIQQRQAIALLFTMAALSITPIAAVAAIATDEQPKSTINTATPTTERIREIDLWLSGQFKPEEPGAIVIISQNGKPLLKKTYGLSNLEKKTPLAFTDVMRIASMTKPFTAMAIMLLEEDGRLTVQDDITRHLPGFATNGNKITIANLLTHTSGLGVYSESPKLLEILRDDTTSADIIKFIQTLPSNSAPGLVTHYNNSGYYILGSLIEKVSGMSYADFMKKRVFMPLQLNRTALETAADAPPLIPGYRVQNGRFSDAPKMTAVVGFSAGSIVSSADDIERWVVAVESRKLLKPATWQRMMTNARLANGTSTEYGYSWRLRKLRGQDIVEHGGNTVGFQSQMMLFPKEQLSFVVMTNQQHRHNAARQVTERIAAMAIGRQFPDLKEVLLSDGVLDQLAGIYEAKDAPARTITRVGKQLRLGSGNAQATLHAYGENVFFQPDVSFTRYRFVKNAAGEVVEMIRIDASDEEKIFTKTAAGVQTTTAIKP